MPLDPHSRSIGRSRPLTRRAFLAGAAALPAGLWLDRALAATGSRGSGAQAACALPHDVLTRIRRGWDPQRAGQILTVPRQWNYLSGAAVGDGFHLNGHISHSTPWHYTADVPMFWYGPGFVRAMGSVDRVVTSVDVAPTISKLIGFPFSAPDGHSMDEAIKPGASKPKLVVVLVWDGGGRFVLDLHPSSWPNLKGLIPKGTWYARATTGSSPTNTPPIHANIGTGAYPRTHGVVDTNLRFEDGRFGNSWSRGPGVLKVPTLADEYAKAKGSAARCACVATLAWHLGMLGQGANLPGGVRHTVALEVQGPTSSSPPTWGLSSQLSPYYQFPAYLNDLPPLKNYWGTADLADGHRDGTWRGRNIGAMLGGFDTPARIPWQARAIREVILREDLGNHDEPDLLFLNYKIIDEVGHMFYADSIEMADTIRVQDRFLASFISFLDQRLPGQWVLLLTADHGHTASPRRTGGVALLEHSISGRVEQRFDSDGDSTPLLHAMRPVWMYLIPQELSANGVQYQAVSRFVAGMTASQVARPNTIRPGHGGDEVFEAVFAGSHLANLTC